MVNMWSVVVLVAGVARGAPGDDRPVWGGQGVSTRAKGDEGVNLLKGLVEP